MEYNLENLPGYGLFTRVILAPLQTTRRLIKRKEENKIQLNKIKYKGCGNNPTYIYNCKYQKKAEKAERGKEEQRKKGRKWKWEENEELGTKQNQKKAITVLYCIPKFIPKRKKEQEGKRRATE